MLGQAKVTTAGRGQAEVTSGRGPRREGQSGSRPGRAPPGKPLAPTRQRACPAAFTLDTRRLCCSQGWAPGPAPGRHQVDRQRRPSKGLGWPRSLPRRLARARSLPAVTFTGCGAARRPGTGQRSPEASATGAAQAARRTAGPGHARRAAPRPEGPAPPREAKPPQPPSWPSSARPPFPSAPAAPRELKARESPGRGAGRGPSGGGGAGPRGAASVVVGTSG